MLILILSSFKSKVTKKRKIKPAVAQEEAVPSSSKTKITKTSVPDPSVKLSTEPAPSLHPSIVTDCAVVISDVMLSRRKSENDNDKTTRKKKTKKRLSRSTSDRSRSLSPPPPMLKKMIKSTRSGSNGSPASSVVSVISRNSSTPPVLDLEVDLEENDNARVREEEPRPQSPIPTPASEVALTPPSPPPPEKQEKERIITGHATDLFRRHLGIFCVCGKEFRRQSILDRHIRLKARPIHLARRTSRSSISITTVTDKEESKRERLPVEKVKEKASKCATSSSSRTRRSSVIAASASAVPVVKVEVPIPSTSAEAPASIPKKVTQLPAKAGRVKGRRISHGLHPSKPLHCKCGFKAPLLGFVKRHIVFFKPDRKFSCQICLRKFLSVRYLSHHYKTFHKVGQTNELITARGHTGKLMNCYVKIKKLDLTSNDGPSQ